MMSDARIAAAVSDGKDRKDSPGASVAEPGGTSSPFDIEDHYDDIYRTAYLLSGRENEAHDLVQETFLRTLKAISKGSILWNPRGYLLRVLRNLFFERTRAERDVLLGEAAIEGFIAENEENRLEHISAITAADICAVLGTLHADFRLPVVLFYFNELCYKEIAKTLEIPIGTVMSRLSRAKRYLKLELLKRHSEQGKE